MTKTRHPKFEATRLAYRTLIQTPEGAMSGEAGDYLETIRIDDRVYQRIVPAWVYEASRKGKKGQKETLPTDIEKACERISQRLLAAFPPEEQTMVSSCEPHDGYPLTVVMPPAS